LPQAIVIGTSTIGPPDRFGGGEGRGSGIRYCAPYLLPFSL
jgi:hypothetical protein